MLLNKEIYCAEFLPYLKQKYIREEITNRVLFGQNKLKDLPFKIIFKNQRVV